MDTYSYFIARQPIVNRREELVAYELLFRSAGSGNADCKSASYATANVIINTMSTFGVEEILGNCKGFINMELELLMDDSLHILPREQVVLELLETLEVTPELVERCRLLKENGFTLALDDHEYSPHFHELYEIIDIVKVDLMQGPQARLEEMVRQFRGYPLQLLAEKVETQEEFRHCLDLGFDLFQGYYFAKPSIMEKKRMDDATSALLKLMRLLNEDSELLAIENTFRGNAGLTYKLLVLVNSVGIGMRSKIETVRHAITILGRHQIKRWIQLALFAGNDQNGLEHPLVDMAAVRAGIMENLADCHHMLKNHQGSSEKAFMTGILSTLEQVYDIPMHEMVQKLNLSDDIRDALTLRHGALGQLLHLAESIEQMEFDQVSLQLEEMNITVEELAESQKRAYGWRSGMA